MNRLLVYLVFLFLLTSCISETSEPQPQYYRVKHDDQLEIYNYKSRTGDKDWGGVGPQTPEVVPLNVQPKLASGTHRTKLTGGWETFINGLNNNDESKLRYLKADNTALFNNTGFPQLESLTMGGNVITLDEVLGEWGIVHTLNHVEPPDIEKINYMTSPDLVHKFVVVGWREENQETYWTNPPKGHMYWPFVSSRPVWIQLERLEKFPELPVKITANTTVYIQTDPGITNDPTASSLLAGRSATVVEYYPSGSNVWGRLKSGGWVALLWYPARDDLQYPTSWKMETLPPPPSQ
jgi:hypothetical protein